MIILRATGILIYLQETSFWTNLSDSSSSLGYHQVRCLDNVSLNVIICSFTETFTEVLLYSRLLVFSRSRTSCFGVCGIIILGERQKFKRINGNATEKFIEGAVGHK